MEVIKNDSEKEPNIQDITPIEESTDLVQDPNITVELLPTPIPDEVQLWQDGQTDYLILPQKTLQGMLDNLAAKDAELEQCYHEQKVLFEIAITIMKLFGMVEKGQKKIKPEILSGEESFVPGMLSSLADVSGLLIKVKLSVTENQKKKNETALAEHFSFLKDLIPLVQKYGEREEHSQAEQRQLTK